MADQAVRIENMPESGSKHRIAFDLMTRIARAEYYSSGNKEPDKPREYCIELYTACRKVVF